MPRFAANLTMMFGEHAFPDRFAAAADCGFTAVEFLFPYDYPPALIAEKLAQNGLTLALFNLPAGDWAGGARGLAALHGADAVFSASVDKALLYAAATGAARMHMMAGLADPADAAAAARYREALCLAADKAGEAGLDLLIEPINGRNMPGYFLNDFNRAADIIAGCGRPNVRLQFDIYHRQILHGDVLTGLETLLPLTGHVQIAAVPHRHEPGTGELDDFRLFEALDALGYRGWVGCEYIPATQTRTGLGWLAKAAGGRSERNPPTP